MDIKKIISEMTTEEKAILLTGATSMTTAEIERLGIESRRLADGTAGVRAESEDNCVLFPRRKLRRLLLGQAGGKKARQSYGKRMCTSRHINDTRSRNEHKTQCSLRQKL